MAKVNNNHVHRRLIKYVGRDCSNLVIGYLTEPPKLPFLRQLTYQTADINYHCERRWFYLGYTVDIDTKLGYFNEYLPYRPQGQMQFRLCKIANRDKFKWSIQSVCPAFPDVYTFTLYPENYVPSGSVRLSSSVSYNGRVGLRYSL
jgi:hypothetical protein